MTMKIKSTFIATVLVIASIVALPAVHAQQGSRIGTEPEGLVKIIFGQPGAVYNPGEKIDATIIAGGDTAGPLDITVEVLDFEKGNGKKLATFSLGKGEKKSVSFRASDLGYFYMRASAPGGGAQYMEKGFGVIPNVTLQEQDWDSPFGVSAHYPRYRDWRIAGVQRKLGIAWTRDEADWKSVAEPGYTTDPYLEYLESNKLCWLPLFDYVSAANGIQGTDGVYRWDKDVALLQKYAQIHKGRFRIYESQNEPNNFGGWKDRFHTDPDLTPYNPTYWGKPFTDLVKQMHDAIKDVDPDVVFMWPGEDLWLEFFAGKWGAGPYMDITSIHPYLHTPRIYPEDEAFAAGYYDEHYKFLDSLAISREMWVTELGWTTFKKPETRDRNYLPVTELQQGAFLVRSWLSHLYYGGKKLFWYEMVDEPFGVENPESSFGLVRYDSMLTVKPAAVAYANLIHNYRHAVPCGRYIGFKEKEVYGFAYTGGDGKPQLCLWRYSDAGKEELSMPNTRMVTVTDIFGRARKVRLHDGKLILDLDIAPVTLTGIDAADFDALHN